MFSTIRFVPNARWVSGRHLPSTCLALQSPPLLCAPGTTVTDIMIPSGGTGGTAGARGAAGEVAIMLSKGQLHLYHLVSGIKVNNCL